jgi:hypothetical protein
MILPWGPITYPASLDSASFSTLIDNVHEVIASHPNSLAAAVLEIEDKLGITNGVATGFGGVSFYTTGKAANPGGAGNPTLWVDNSGGPNFHIMYTDELGVDHDLISAAGITDLQDAYDGGSTIVVAGTDPVYIDSGLLSDTVLLYLRQNDSTNNPDCLVIENNSAGMDLYIYGSIVAPHNITCAGELWVNSEEYPLRLIARSDSGLECDTELYLQARQDSTNFGSNVYVQSYCTDVGCPADSQIWLETTNMGSGDSGLNISSLADSGTAFLDCYVHSSAGATSYAVINVGGSCNLTMRTDPATGFGYVDLNSYTGWNYNVAVDGDFGSGSLATDAYNAVADFMCVTSGTGTSTAQLYSQAAAAASSLAIYSESVSVGNSTFDLYSNSASADSVFTIYSKADNQADLTIQVQDDAGLSWSSLLLTQTAGSGYFELQATGVGEWSLVAQYEGLLFVGSTSTGANVGQCFLYAAADADACVSAIAISGSAQGYVCLGYDLYFGTTGADFLVFSDNNNTGSTWVAEYMLFSAGTAEWDTFKANYGEVSLLNAINQAAGGGGGSLQDSYDLGNTIAVAGVTPVFISCADADGSILLSLENNDITNNFHCMTIENNANSALVNIYTDAHSINLSGSNSYHQIVDSISAMTADFSVYAYTTGLEGSTLTSTFGIMSLNDDEDSGAYHLTSYFQTYSDAIYDDGEGQGPIMYSYFRTIYDDAINGPDANVVTHTYLSSIGSGGPSDVYVEATSGKADIYVIATSSGTLGAGTDDSYVQVEALAIAGEATTEIISVGAVAAYTSVVSISDDTAITYIDSVYLGLGVSAGYIAIGTQAAANIDIVASGSGAILNLSSESDSAFNYVHIWAVNSDDATSSEVRIGANSDFSAYAGIVTFCDNYITGSTWVAECMLFSAGTAEWDTFEANYGEVSLLNALNQAAGGGGSLQVSYDLGNTIAVASATPVYISCADEDGSILLSLENNDATNNPHCMTIENNAQSVGNIYTDAHSINLSGSNSDHQIVNTVSTTSFSSFGVYSYLTGLEDTSIHTATFGTREESSGVEHSGVAFLTSYFQTHTTAVCGGESGHSDISAYFRSHYDDSINGPDTTVDTHTYLSSTGSGGLSDIWIEATSGQAAIYITATADGLGGDGDGDAFVEVQAYASLTANLELESIGDAAYIWIKSEGNSDAVTYIDSSYTGQGGTGSIKIGTESAANIDVVASGSGAILNLSSDSDSAFNYVHIWAANSDTETNSEVRIGANSDFSAYAGLVTFCD